MSLKQINTVSLLFRNPPRPIGSSPSNPTQVEQETSNKGELKNSPMAKDISGEGPNATRLRNVLDQLGYREKGIEIDNGGDISSNMADVSISIFKKIKELYPNYKIIVTGGNDFYHHQLGYVSRHTKGNALDFTISPHTENDLDNIVNILRGFAKGLNPDFRFIDEYRHLTSAGTGDHFHMSWGEGTEGQASLTEALNNSPVSYNIT
jgi:hypothetical protein